MRKWDSFWKTTEAFGCSWKANGSEIICRCHFQEEILPLGSRLMRCFRIHREIMKTSLPTDFWSILEAVFRYKAAIFQPYRRNKSWWSDKWRSKNQKFGRWRQKIKWKRIDILIKNCISPKKYFRVDVISGKFHFSFRSLITCYIT